MGLAIVVACLGLLAAPARAADSGSYSTAGEFGASPPAGVQGTLIHVSGTGFKAGSPVDLTYAGSVLPVASADGAGVLAAAFSLPAVPAGAYDLTAKGAGPEGLPISYKALVTVLPGQAVPDAVVTPAGTPTAATPAAAAPAAPSAAAPGAVAAVPAAPKQSTGLLPTTGLRLLIPLLVFSLVALGLGTILVLSARRRRTR